MDSINDSWNYCLKPTVLSSLIKRYIWQLEVAQEKEIYKSEMVSVPIKLLTKNI